MIPKFAFISISLQLLFINLCLSAVLPVLDDSLGSCQDFNITNLIAEVDNLDAPAYPDFTASTNPLIVFRFNAVRSWSTSGIAGPTGKAVLDLAIPDLDDPTKATTTFPQCGDSWELGSVRFSIGNEFNNPAFTYGIAALAAKGYQTWIGDRPSFKFPTVQIRGEAKNVYGFMSFFQPPGVSAQ